MSAASDRPLHVGFNLVFLVPGETGGMEVAARELISALVAEAPSSTRFTAFVNREAAAAGGAPWGELLPAVTVPVKARRREQWVLGEQTLLPALAARARVGLVHSLASTAPLWGPFRRVVTIHDLIYAHYPEAHAGLRDRGMRVLVPAAAQRSERVLVDSHSTKDDVERLIGLPTERIDVVPLGVRPPSATPAASARKQARERFQLGDRRVLLTLAAKRPHKNLAALIGALARIEPARRPLLVIPGYPTWHERELREHVSALRLDADVRFFGWLSEGEVEALWASADAFVFPSLYEGFGLPVLEAMARGVPVACAEASSLPEVAGDAAILFDPHDERAIAQAVERVLEDEPLRAELRERGRRRVARFSWAETARLTLASYARALTGR